MASLALGKPPKVLQNNHFVLPLGSSEITQGSPYPQRMEQSVGDEGGNPKSSPLLDLPTEIRLRIYQYSLLNETLVFESILQNYRDEALAAEEAENKTIEGSSQNTSRFSSEEVCSEGIHDLTLLIVEKMMTLSGTSATTT